MPELRQDARVDVLGQVAVRHPLWIGEHLVFVGLVVLATLEAVSGDGRSALIVLGAALLVCWYALGVVAIAPTGSVTAVSVWLLVLTGTWAGLLIASSAFTWVAFPLFLLYVLLLPPRVAVPAVGVVTVGVLIVQLSSNDDDAASRVVGPLIGAGVAILLGLNLRLLSHESDRRRVLIDELVETQRDLVATHDELARVQRETGALGERERLARDIHDTLAQGLTSIRLRLRDARAAAPDASPALVDALEDCERLVGENLDEARRVVGALSPGPLESTPLADALQRLTERLAEQTHAQVRWTTEGEPVPLATAHEVALLRVAQSALANVRQHSGAGEVAVTLSYLPDAVTLDIVDDGIGFDPEQLVVDNAPTRAHDPRGPHRPDPLVGFGLRAMRGRLAELGGTLVIESAPGEGTAVAAAIPVVVNEPPVIDKRSTVNNHTVGNTHGGPS